MFRYAVIILTVLTFSVVHQVVSARKKSTIQNQNGIDNQMCSFNTQVNLPKLKDPLLLIQSSTGTSLVHPVCENKVGIIFLQADEKLLVACPSKRGQQNKVSISKKEVAVGICDGEKNTIEFEWKEATATDLQCEYAISPELKITNNKCGDGIGTFLEIGYTVQSVWYNIIDICHNIDKADSYFAIHQLYGSALEGAITSSQRKPFMIGSSKLYTGFSPDADYKQENQKQLLNKLLGGNLGDLVYNATLCARGHLAPDADQYFVQGQLATYFYVNAAPQFQSINGGNWVTVEKNVRKLAIQLNKTLTIVTGTYGVLQLPNINNRLVEIYFEPKTSQLRVPEIVWKLVVNPDDSSCIVFVSVNNPYIESPPQTICPDITETSGWPALQDSYIKGYMYTCDYNDFKKTVTYVPAYSCQSVQKWPFSFQSNKRKSRKG